jgi:hypothetical protein
VRLLVALEELCQALQQLLMDARLASCLVLGDVGPAQTPLQVAHQNLSHHGPPGCFHVMGSPHARRRPREDPLQGAVLGRERGLRPHEEDLQCEHKQVPEESGGPPD